MEIPIVCTIPDICRILQLSRAQYFRLKKNGQFPLPEMEPKLDRKHRYRGADVRALVDGDYR